MSTTAPTVPAAYLPLDDHERRELLRIARVCVKEWLRSGRLPPGAPHRAPLKQVAACVVKVLLDDQVREGSSAAGSEQPLYKAVSCLAVELAGREPPLRAEDLARAHFEIAVLAPHASESTVADVFRD